MENNENGIPRNLLFISKATPEDDEFVLWFAPKLEAAGYKVFADILTLTPGDRWRKEITGKLQNNAIKMLLCCNDTTLAKNGVQEEIAIAEDLSKELNDPRFIIPLRIKPFKKLFGIGGLHYVDFVGSWASGLKDLLKALEDQNVIRDQSRAEINPNWEAYKKRLAISVEATPEKLTSNWIRILELPEYIYFYSSKGAVDFNLLKESCKLAPYPAQQHHTGFFTFMSPEEIENHFSHVGRFKEQSKLELTALLEGGSENLKIRQREVSNMVVSMLRQSWNCYCRSKNLYEYAYSSLLGFHITKDQIPLGKRLPWGDKKDRRSSVLRNIKNGKVWQYGVSAIPSLWPFPHFKIKARVMFSELVKKEAGAVYDDPAKQHRYRRTECSGWRNKAWHGRLMAFMKIVADENGFIDLALSEDIQLRLDAVPLIFNSPVSTAISDQLDEDEEERDMTTLGNFSLEEGVED